MKQGPFPSRAVVLSDPLKRYYKPLRHPPGRHATSRDHRLYAPIASRASFRRLGAGEGFSSSRTHPATVPIPLPRGVLDRCNPGSTRRPWPSPSIPWLGSPLTRSRGLKLTGRQDSLDATDRSLARLQGTLDTGLRRRTFPPDAASLLPGALALTGTGLPPAGGCELTFGSGHVQAPPPNSGHTDRPLSRSYPTIRRALEAVRPRGRRLGGRFCLGWCSQHGLG